MKLIEASLVSGSVEFGRGGEGEGGRGIGKSLNSHAEFGTQTFAYMFSRIWKPQSTSQTH